MSKMLFFCISVIGFTISGCASKTKISSPEEKRSALSEPAIKGKARLFVYKTTKIGAFTIFMINDKELIDLPSNSFTYVDLQEGIYRLKLKHGGFDKDEELVIEMHSGERRYFASVSSDEMDAVSWGVMFAGGFFPGSPTYLVEVKQEKALTDVQNLNLVFNSDNSSKKTEFLPLKDMPLISTKPVPLNNEQNSSQIKTENDVRSKDTDTAKKTDKNELGKKTIEQRLNELEELKRKKIITNDEYQKKRDMILNEL